MPDTPWKAFERRVAALFGGIRRGPDTRGVASHATISDPEYPSEGGGGDRRSQGKSDIIHPFWSPECKLLGRPSFAALLGAARQAESNAEPHHCPVAIVKRKLRGSPDTEALVVMRLETFCEWFV